LRLHVHRSKRWSEKPGSIVCTVTGASRRVIECCCQTHTHTHTLLTKQNPVGHNNTTLSDSIFRHARIFKKWLLHVVAYVNCVGHYYTALHRTQHTGKWLRKTIRNTYACECDACAQQEPKKLQTDDFCFQNEVAFAGPYQLTCATQSDRVSDACFASWQHSALLYTTQQEHTSFSIERH